mmetsp:Transcript_49920/g.55741  ORF Transcript_49920/g.55741 Transcript_49920/m.55741 type:complete len:608 (+) Transcript_49920:30-1853(+)
MIIGSTRIYNNVMNRRFRRKRCRGKPITSRQVISAHCYAAIAFGMMMMMMMCQIQHYSAFRITSPVLGYNRQITSNKSSSVIGTALGGGGGKKEYTYDGAAVVSDKKKIVNTLTKIKKRKKKSSDNDNFDRVNEDRSRWLSWMTMGTRTETKKREAEELGGVLRSERYSSSDWIHNTLSLPNSAILKAIREPVLFMSCWAGFLSALYRYLSLANSPVAKMMCLPTTPHSLMSSVLSLLLVFKTNSAYQRFAEGRKIWENIINNSRDLYRMMNLYEREMGRSKRRRLQRLLAAFPYLLRHRIRPNLIMHRVDDEANVRNPEHSIVLYQDKARNDLDPEAAAVATQEENEGKSRRKRRPLYWVDKRTLPWRLLPPGALEACARAQNRPLWVCDRMAHELRYIPDQIGFTNRERLTLIAKVENLSSSIGSCERIHQTAVPLNYARHSLRALSIWLFTLPFCLVESLELLTAPTIFLVSWLMFGVYEIGCSIEDPFQKTLRLSVLCDTIRRDVLADEVIRSTAFENEEGKRSTSSSDTDQNIQRSNKDQDLEEEEDNEDNYESSSIVKEPRQVLVIEKKQKPRKKKNKNVKPLVVEELPILPSKKTIWEEK